MSGRDVKALERWSSQEWFIQNRWTTPSTPVASHPHDRPPCRISCSASCMARVHSATAALCSLSACVRSTTSLPGTPSPSTVLPLLPLFTLRLSPCTVPCSATCASAAEDCAACSSPEAMESATTGRGRHLRSSRSSGWGEAVLGRCTLWVCTAGSADKGAEVATPPSDLGRERATAACSPPAMHGNSCISLACIQRREVCCLVCKQAHAWQHPACE